MNLQPQQAATRPPTSYEHALADELEAIYGGGTHDLEGVVAALNRTGVRPPGGAEWTTDAFTAELGRLASTGFD